MSHFMRRSERALLRRDDIESILKHGEVCRIAVNTGAAPYIVPLNYGFAWENALHLFFHGAQEGRKHTLIAHDARVGFEIDVQHELVEAPVACGWGMKYRSVIGHGLIVDVTAPAEKRLGLDCLMRQYGYPGQPEFSDLAIQNIRVYKLMVHEVTAKARA